LARSDREGLPTVPWPRTQTTLSFTKPLARPVTLAEMKANAKLKNFDLVRLPRLSIMPVSEEQWKIIEEMAKR